MSTNTTQGSHSPDRWYFTKEQLENTPSRKCGYDAEKELSCRQQAANLIQDMGQRLQVTQLCINTAIVYMHRFYVFHSFTQFHRNSIATAALFLAAKVEEQPRKLEHVIRVAQLCLFKNQPPLDPRSEAYQEQAQEIVVNENVLLQTLGFDVGIEHPHTYVVKCCHLVRASKDLAQTSYFMASNSLHLTTMCLQYRSTVVACFCIHLACKWANWEIPQSNEGRKWFWYIDKEVTQEQLEQLTEEFLAIFDKCPSKLKKRICSISSNQNSTLMAAFDGDSKKMSGLGNATFAPPHSTSGRVTDDKRRSEHNGPPPEYRKLMAGGRDMNSRSSTSSTAVPINSMPSANTNKPPAHVFQTSSSSRVPPPPPPHHHHSSAHVPKIKTEHPPMKVEPVMKEALLKQPPLIKQEPNVKQEPYIKSEPHSLLPLRKHEPINPRMMMNKPQSKPVIPHEVRKNGHDLPVPKPHPPPPPPPPPYMSAAKLPPPSHSDVITNVIKEVTYSKQMEKSSILNHKESSISHPPHLSMSIPQTKAPSIFSPEKNTSPVINKTPFKMKTPTPPSFSPIKISPSKSSEGLKAKLEPELVPVITKLGDDILTKPKILASEIISETKQEPHESHSQHPKKKKKHKEKDKDRDKKHKEKKKHKDDKHKDKRKDKHRESSHVDPAPIKITIPKDKIIEMPCSSNLKKIKMKDSFENPLKIRISKDFLSKDSKKRERDTDDSDYPSSKRMAS
ncbi:cyclin-T2 isoform X1 [Diaphorina citri]|jgi:Cdk activating kinase (CAK)/RNA polymerase II transcription initiation/nucleotide excision repair factor TFIIH/TFIIK, cyclin H subunit|uniref:Cyclin-T2 isoform X1 n=1 Tax=Diaphorina citri TaxID=121845 RepID=A0A1S3DAJ1_DIACI|nr:cyclin-T2 isoform X1 [Diaphorina citri]